MGADGRGQRLGQCCVSVGNVLLHPATQGLQQRVNLVDLGFELETETYAAARLLPFEIDAGAIVAGAPGACRLRPITFDFASFA